MIPKELNDWLQVIGLFGVIGGLLFVGLELRLARQVALTDAVANAYDARVSMADLVAQSPEVWVKGISGEPLSVVEQVQFDGLARAYELRAFSAYDRAVRLGRSPAGRHVREFASELYSNPGLWRWWIAYNENLRRWDSGSGDESDSGWTIEVQAEVDRLMNAN